MNPRETAEELLVGFKINLPSAHRAAVIEAMVAGMVIAAAESADKEREACASIADDADKSTHPAEIADRIRARGNPEPDPLQTDDKSS